MKAEDTNTQAATVSRGTSDCDSGNNDNPLAVPPQAKHTLDGSAETALTRPPDLANPERRILLGGALAVSAAAFLPTAFAAAADNNAAGEAFLSVSKALCGHDALDRKD